MRLKILLLTLVLLFSVSAQQRYYNLGDMQLSSGEKLVEAKIGYRTFGTMNSQKSNVIAFLSWYAGSSEDLSKLLGKDKFIDTTKYFAILIDAFGNGISTSPTNYKAGLTFPDVTIADMVKSEYLLLTKEMGLQGIHAFIGGSMGGMQVFQWMVDYPNYAKKFIPYVATPVQSSVNQLIFESSLLTLQTIEKYGVPDSVANKIFDLNFYLFARTPSKVDSLNKPEKYNDFLNKFRGVTAVRFPASNRITQMKAMVSYDITKAFGGSMEEAAKAIKGEVFVIVSKSDHLILPYQAIKFAGILKCNLLVLEADCGHLAPGCEMEKVSKAIQMFLSK